MAEIEDKIMNGFKKDSESPLHMYEGPSDSGRSAWDTSSMFGSDQYEKTSSKDGGSREGSQFVRDYTTSERMTRDLDTGEPVPMTGELQEKLRSSIGEVDVWNTKSKDQKLGMMTQMIDMERAGAKTGEITTYTPEGKMLSVGRGTGKINPDYPDAPIMPKYWTNLGDGVKETTSQAWESASASHADRMTSLESLSAEDRSDPDKVRDIWYPKASIEVGQAQVVETYKPQYTGVGYGTKPYTGQR